MGTVLSDEKQMHLSHVILQSLERTAEGRFVGSSTLALREIKLVLAEHMLLEKEIDKIVRARLQSYSRKILEGTSEWDVMYQKTYEEELRKRKLG
jgi:hypothetical protein